MLLIGCWVSLLSCHSFAQVDTSTVVSATDSLEVVQYQKKWTAKVEGKRIAVDALQNIYVLNSDNELIQYSPKGKENYRYSNYDLGNISHIDVNNPFNILVFYKEHQTVKILDRTLTPISSFDIFQTGITYVQAIGMSNDQAVWVYDEVNFKLKKLDHTGTVILESGDVSQIIPSDFTPSFLVAVGNKVYLSAFDSPVFIFDNLGNYHRKTTFSIPSSEFQVIQGKIVYSNNVALYIQDTNPLAKSSRPFLLPDVGTPIKSISIYKNQIWILGTKALYLYKFLLK